VAQSHLGALLGRRQARYLLELERMFERGDIDEALRRALPTTDRSSGTDTPRFHTPGRRASLELRIGPESTIGGSFALGSDWFLSLRRTYRDSVRRLVAQGDINKAAFVLLDLLDEPVECVELLERHNRVAMAAELAEARELEPGLVVRLWFLAKQPRRAIAAAKRTGAFADAVARLESANPEQAAALRLLWADCAASAGDYPTAVDVAWRVDTARALVSEWMDRSVAAGGPAGAAMLARKLQRDDGDVAAVATTISSIVTSTEQHAERHALARGLTEFPSDRGRLVAPSVLRAVLADAAARPNPEVHRTIRSLATLEGGLVRADLPRLRPTSSTPQREPLHIVVHATDVGTLPLLDAVPLPDGRALVALGELGVGLVNRRGALAHRFPCPCDSIVLADSGLRALALRRRGSALSASKIDLETRRATPWGDLEVGSHARTYARTYDGVRWFVAGDRDLAALDVQADTPTTLWRVPDVSVVAMARSRDCLEVVMSGPLTAWHYELPRLVLRSRTPLELDKGVFLAAHAADGRRATVRLADAESDDPARVLVIDPDGRSITLDPPGNVSFHGRWVASVATSEASAVARVYDGPGSLVASVLFHEAGQVSLHSTGSRLGCADKLR
jgi:hypothetical protein